MAGISDPAAVSAPSTLAANWRGDRRDTGRLPPGSTMNVYAHPYRISI